MRDSVVAGYEALVASGAIERDAAQAALASRLDRVAEGIAARSPRRGGLLGWFTGSLVTEATPRGLYVHGDVGRGKTLLMDLFFNAAPTLSKRRVHFHAFMGEVHERVAKLRTAPEADGRDPVGQVAHHIADEIRLLCFDEFAVYDIADAMILGRLFAELFVRGVVVVATSNVAPDDLYRDGLNRALFLPFVSLLKEHMDVAQLTGERDYRRSVAGVQGRYIVPADGEAEATLAAQFLRLTGRVHGERREIEHKGRRIEVPEAADGAARFTFADLCAQPLGAGDYLALADAFHTLFVSGVPLLDEARRNEAKRFIALIDTLYDRRVRLILSAEAEPDALWRGESGVEDFEFERTASRLNEMRGDAYWDAAGERSAPRA